MNYHVATARTRHGSAVAGSTATHQPIGTASQRSECVGPALLAGARVSVAHRSRQLVQPTVEGASSGGQHASGHKCRMRVRRVDVDKAIPHSLTRPAHRVSVGFGHRPVDLGGQPTARQRRKPRKPHRQKRIHSRQRIGVGDQVCPKNDGLKGAIVDIAGLKRLADLW
jgi:hypothetical protein